MNISAKIEYACIAVLELSMRYDLADPVQIRVIAEKHGVPPRFLVQILLQLKNSGIVQSTRGASGGYQLTRAPEEINLLDVMAAIDASVSELVSNAAHSTAVSKTLIDYWNGIIEQQQTSLSTITFSDLVQRVRQTEDNMYYI